MMPPLGVVRLYSGSLARGAVVTVEVTASATAVALGIGVVGAAARLAPLRPLKLLATGYVELVRGTPQILQLFIIYFGLTQFRIILHPLQAAFIWLALYGGAYAIEIFRAGIASVAAGQREAATALGLSAGSTFRRVVLPQAVAVVLPALTSFLVLQLKASSLVYTIGVPDIMYRMRLGVNTIAQPLLLYTMAAVAYILLNLPLSRLGAMLERRVALYR